MLGAIFDMDGLMFDTEKIWQKNWDAVADEMNITLPPEFRKEICGTSGALMQSVIEKFYHVENGKEIMIEVITRYHKNLEQEVPEKPGIHEILKWFKDNGYRLAVASSSAKEIIERNLEMTNTKQYFDVWCSGQEVEHGKPAPDLFLLAASRIGVDPKDCYIFEDAYNGIRAAHASGGKPIMIPDSLEPNEEMEEKTYLICDSLLDALEHIKK